MAVVYNATLKNTRMNDVLDAIETGAGANGTMEIGISGMGTILATLALNSPCGTVTDDHLDFDAPFSDVSADATGTAVEARIKDKDGNVVVSNLSVGVIGSGANVVLGSVALTVGTPVVINTGIITHG